MSLKAKGHFEWRDLALLFALHLRDLELLLLWVHFNKDDERIKDCDFWPAESQVERMEGRVLWAPSGLLNTSLGKENGVSGIKEQL